MQKAGMWPDLPVFKWMYCKTDQCFKGRKVCARVRPVHAPGRVTRLFAQSNLQKLSVWRGSHGNGPSTEAITRCVSWNRVWGRNSWTALLEPSFSAPPSSTSCFAFFSRPPQLFLLPFAWMFLILHHLSLLSFCSRELVLVHVPSLQPLKKSTNLSFVQSLLQS